MVVGDSKRTANIMDGIENTGDVRMHDHRLRLKQRFDIVRKLGQGTYGKVQLGINKKTGQEVAIKTIKKCKIESEADLIRIRREVQIMSSVRHPNIVHIYEVFENSEKMILVMEYCSGGELYDYLSQKKVLQEDEARRLFRQIATAVYYCHIHKICHRDLKLENVLLDDTGSAKIADFGLSNVFKETSLLSTFCGSPLYASPEIVKGTPYIGPEVDCWSLGVLLYTLVYGAMPFDGSNFKRLVRQISNGDYYEPRTPSTASPLIRDMLTVDPLKRADIAYICDHPWVNTGCETSCLEMSEALAAETPVRLDLLLSLAPAAPSNSHSVVVPAEAQLGPEESGTDLTSSVSMPVEPSNSAEKRILELVAEGGEDAIKPSPTRTIVTAGENKRKLELAMSASGLQRKKERVASVASMGSQAAALPEEAAAESPPVDEPAADDTAIQPSLKSSATITISPAPAVPLESLEPAKQESPKEEPLSPTKEKTGAKPRIAVKKKASPTKTVEEKTTPDKDEAKQQEEPKPSAVAAAADKLTSLSIAQTPETKTPIKPKKLSIPGGNVGSFKDQFERRASLTTAPEIKRNISKPVVSKIAKPKAQSEDRELPSKMPQDNGTVRLQQIGIEPSSTPPTESEPNRGGVKKTESEPTHGVSAADPSVLLQDARRSLQNSMAKLVEEKAGEESRRRAARDIISSAIRTGKPPVPYGRSSSAGVTMLSSPPGTPSAPAPAPSTPRLFRTEAQHRVEDHRPRGVSVERIIPIHMSEESPTSPTAPAQTRASPAPAPAPAPTSRPVQVGPVRRLISNESVGTSNASECSSPGEPIKKSAREFIIPIAVEGKGYVTPRQRSLEPESPAAAAAAPSAAPSARLTRTLRPRRISSLVSGGESEEEDDSHMHRLRPSRLARADSASSGEEDEEDEGFHLLTAENLFSTLLHRVRALTQRLNGEEGPGFPQHPHSLFNNLQSPFTFSPHLPRRHLLREGWGSRDLHADFDSMFNKSRQSMPRGSRRRSSDRTKSRQRGEDAAEAEAGAGAGGEGDEADGEGDELDLSAIELSEREMRALHGLTPALSRRLQRQLLASLPPGAARSLRRTLSLHAAPAPLPARAPRSHSACPTPDPSDPTSPPPPPPSHPDDAAPDHPTHYSTLPRLRRRSSTPRDTTPDPEPEPSLARRTSIERPLLSKYLTPERHLSLEEPPTETRLASTGPRRASLRLAGETPRKRISRFLRSDFFDAPSEETAYARHRKEKELETQKILREIREKRGRALADQPSAPAPPPPAPPSPLNLGKERSRSGTPFFPSLDNIKETTADAPAVTDDSKLTRPKSYPVKTLHSIEEPRDDAGPEPGAGTADSARDKRESRLIRPKSYPTTSPSPEKVYVSRAPPTDAIVAPSTDDARLSTPKDDVSAPRAADKPDVEVSFSITLPRKKPDPKQSPIDSNETKPDADKKSSNGTLVLKKYQVVTDVGADESERSEGKVRNGSAVANGTLPETAPAPPPAPAPARPDDMKSKATGVTVKKEDGKRAGDSESGDKKGTIKKKIIRKVASKSKTDLTAATETGDRDAKPAVDKKKITKKAKEKVGEEEKSTSAVPKKKSMLQSIGHKLEKFASSKSSSPEKLADSVADTKKDASKQRRMQREQSVPVAIDPPTTESTLIKRAVTLTDVAALDTHPATPTPTVPPNKTTVSKVLGLFRKFEPKDKTKPVVEKCPSVDTAELSVASEPSVDLVDTDKDRPRRPTSLLLNGLGRKHKYGRTASDSVTDLAKDDQALKKEDTKNPRNSLKLDFSRLPRVKKIVPTNSVIEPQIMNISSVDDETEKRDISEKVGAGAPVRPVTLESILNNGDSSSRSRSRSRSTVSNSEIKSDLSAEIKSERNPISPSDNGPSHPFRNHESTTPEKEDIVDRIRRKSFYSRFNEKKQRRKSNLVGPGAIEYDPLARIHAPPTDYTTKYDISPTSPSVPPTAGAYDLSPASDLSPSTERYRTLLADLAVPRTNYKYDRDGYGINDKIDTYRSLDRNDFRKYPGTRSYLDYEPLSYGGQRYSRTKSLMESSDGGDDILAGSPSGSPSPRDPLKYNRTVSMYSPGNYATYRPKRTAHNPAIILKESETEPSPENVLDKIRQRKKISISVTRKPDSDKESLPRSPVPSKGESDGTECSEKAD